MPLSRPRIEFFKNLSQDTKAWRDLLGLPSGPCLRTLLPQYYDGIHKEISNGLRQISYEQIAIGGDLSETSLVLRMQRRMTRISQVAFLRYHASLEHYLTWLTQCYCSVSKPKALLSAAIGFVPGVLRWHSLCRGELDWWRRILLDLFNLTRATLLGRSEAHLSTERDLGCQVPWLLRLSV